MDQTLSALTHLGLTTTEAQIYLAGLSHGTMTIRLIGSTTNVKRPTIYHALATLREKGLVAEHKRNGKSEYTFVSSEHLRALIAERREAVDKQEQVLDALLPLLQNRSTVTEGMSVVQHSGVEGMKLVMDIAFYCKSKRWDIIAPYTNFLREFDTDYAQRYLRARKHYGITSRSLWEHNMRGRALTTEEKRERNPRLMPPEMWGKFKSMMILFDDKIAIFSSFNSPSALLITSKELHGMFASIFESLWSISETY